MNIKQSYLCFYIATAVSVLLRTIMLFFAIDSSSGFIKSEYALISVIIFVFIALGALLTFSFSLSSKAVLAKKQMGGLVLKLISVCLAAATLYDTLFTAPSYTISAPMKILELAFAVISAVYLVSVVITEHMGYDFPLIFSVAPVLFWFIRLIVVFTSFSTLANIPDNIFELAALCLILISSLQLSKSLCLELSKKAEALNFGLFLITSFTCFTTALPKAVIMISGNSELLHDEKTPFLTILFAGLYFLSVAINRYKDKA